MALKSAHGSFTAIPIIDVGALLSCSEDTEAFLLAADQLHQACRDVGFFYVTNHGVPEQLITGVLQLSRQWFALPASTKQELAVSPARHFRGYQALGVNVTRYAGGFQRDWHEAIDLFREEDAAQIQAAGLPPSPLHGPNPWPHHIPELEAVLRTYIEHCKTLGSAIMRGIAVGLGLPPAVFQGDQAGRDSSYWLLRSIFYPPLSQGSTHQPALPQHQEEAEAAPQAAAVGTAASTGAGEAAACDAGRQRDTMPDPPCAASAIDREAGQQQDGSSSCSSAAAPGLLTEAARGLSGSEVDRTVQLSCGEHTDYGLLTMVNQDQGVTALQVKNAAGVWVDAHPIPGTLVCNIGDMMKVWTNGAYQATMHRVINGHPTKSRVSIPFFFEPAFEAVVQPLPELLARQGAAAGLAGGPAPALFHAVRYGTHLESKVLNNFET